MKRKLIFNSLHSLLSLAVIGYHLRECGVLQATTELTQANLWLAITPGAMATWVWDVTAAVAIYAIDQGRRELDSVRSEDLGPGVRLISYYNQGANKLALRARGASWQGRLLRSVLRTGRRHSSMF